MHLSLVLCDDLEGRDEWVLMADSGCCTAETNVILYSNYPSIKNIFLKESKVKYKTVNSKIKSSLELTYTHYSEVAQSCLTLCHPVDCSPPGSSVHGILQARVLEWGAIAFSREAPTIH